MFARTLFSFLRMLFFFFAQAEYSYFSTDFRLKIFLYYSYIIAYGSFVLFRIYWAINYKRLVSGSGSRSVHCACALDTTFRSEAKMSRQNIFFIYKKCTSRQLSFFQYQTRTAEWFDIFFPECTSREYYVIE